MKHFLITGGAGFIGTNLSKNLLNNNHTVTVIDNLITSDKKNVLDLLKNKNYTFIKHDISKPFPIKKIKGLQKVDFVFHLACPTGVPNIKMLGEEMLLTCSIGTRNILEYVKTEKIPLLFTSSSEIYGNPQEFPQKESYTGNVDPQGQRSAYEEGKRFSEALVTLYVTKYNVNAKTVRLFNTYGPYMSQKDLRVVPQFLMNAKHDKAIIIYGNGRNTRTFLYIDDLIRALLLISKKGKKGEVYNIGSTREVSVNKLAMYAIKVTKSKSKVIYKKSTIEDHVRRKPDVSKLKKLGWKQTIHLSDGLKKTYAWLIKTK